MLLSVRKERTDRDHGRADRHHEITEHGGQLYLNSTFSVFFANNGHVTTNQMS